MPSADEATDFQPRFGALVLVQAAPEFVEVQIEPPWIAATNFVPSAEEATAFQLAMGALVNVQV